MYLPQYHLLFPVVSYFSTLQYNNSNQLQNFKHFTLIWENHFGSLKVQKFNKAIKLHKQYKEDFVYMQMQFSSVQFISLNILTNARLQTL